MSAVVLLASAFLAIAVVGTALAAVHDAIAGAMDRARDESERARARPASVTVLRSGTERRAPHTASGPVLVRVRVRCGDGAVSPSARA